MKSKVYFISPGRGFKIYYMMKENCQGGMIDVGYNDSYEMRGVKIYPPYVSENLEDIKAILKKRKQALIASKYKEMFNIMKIDVNQEPQYHDGFDAPIGI